MESIFRQVTDFGPLMHKVLKKVKNTNNVSANAAVYLKCASSFWGSPNGPLS